MSATTVIKLSADHLAAEARALAPGDGRSREIEIDAIALRTWLENFAALPALETEDADARLYIAVPSRRLVVRRAGGRLGTEEGGTFVAATVDEIVGQLLAGTPRSTGAVEAPASELLPPPPKARVRAQAGLLVGLIVVLVGAWWWALQPELPAGVEWIGDGPERQSILGQAAGSYASDNERLSIDAASARLIAINEDGEETLRTTVRVGRRAGVAVLATEAGVLLEITAVDKLRIDAIDYKRVAAVQ